MTSLEGGREGGGCYETNGVVGARDVAAARVAGRGGGVPKNLTLLECTRNQTDPIQYTYPSCLHSSPVGRYSQRLPASAISEDRKEDQSRFNECQKVHGTEEGSDYHHGYNTTSGKPRNSYETSD